MASKGICKIDGCGKPALTRGWCENHYGRWRRHGDPLGGGTARGEPIRFYREIVLPYKGDDCLIWPFSRSSFGYGVVKSGGRQHPVHRLSCDHRHGPPPTPEHEAAHSCGKGHLGCVNQMHVSWKTHKENQADQIAHGTICRGERNGSVILTERQVREIRKIGGTLTQTEIAQLFGVSQPTVGQILAKQSWAWLADQ